MAVVIARLTSADTISDLTTGRTDVYAQYLEAICKNAGTFLFGYGLDDEGLFKDTHNLVLELAYYIGVIGMVLYIGFYSVMFKKMNGKLGSVSQNVIAKYILVIMMIALYFSLNGAFVSMFYSEAFLTLMAVLLIKPVQQDVSLTDHRTCQVLKGV